MLDKVKEYVDKRIEEIENAGIKNDDVITLYRLINIKENISKIEMNEEEKNMYYDDDERMSARGGRRGRSSYGRGEQAVDRIEKGYSDYMEHMDRYERGGNYGAKNKMTEAIEYTMMSIYDLIEVFMDNVTDPEAKETINKYAKKIKEMTM